jgi:hypothetical protein
MAKQGTTKTSTKGGSLPPALENSLRQSPNVEECYLLKDESGKVIDWAFNKYRASNWEQFEKVENQFFVPAVVAEDEAKK